MHPYLSQNNVLRFVKTVYFFNSGFSATLVLLLPFISQELHFSLSQVGFLGGLLSFMGIVIALPSAYLSERFGSLKIIAVSFLICGVVLFFISFSSTFLFFTFLFFIKGINEMVYPVTNAFITQHSDKKKRGKILGEFTALADIGKISTSTIILFLIPYIGWRLGALSCAFIVVLFMGYYSFKRIYKKDRTEEGEKTENKIKDVSWKETFKNKRFLLAIMVTFFDTIAGCSVALFLPFLLMQKGIDKNFLWFFMGLFFVGYVFGKILFGKLADTFGNVKMFSLAEICMAICIVLLTQTSSVFFILLFSVLLGMMTRGTQPLRLSMIAESVDHHGRYEKAFGANTFFANIANMFSPLLLGIIAEQYSINSAFYISALFAILAIMPAILFSAVPAKKI